MDALTNSNSVFTRLGPGITLGCMDPDARDLMDRALKAHEELVRAGKRRRRVRDFTYWLFKESGLVDDVEDAALKGHARHWARIVENLKGHPNPAYRRRMSRRCIYGFAYWFFRWSGLVGPDGRTTKESP